jgi:hypothetical protein
MFRFTIRDVLWLTVVVALGVVLWIERASIKRERVLLDKERASLKADQAGVKLKQQQLVRAMNAVMADLKSIGN